MPPFLLPFPLWFGSTPSLPVSLLGGRIAVVQAAFKRKKMKKNPEGTAKIRGKTASVGLSLHLCLVRLRLSED